MNNPFMKNNLSDLDATQRVPDVEDNAQSTQRIPDISEQGFVPQITGDFPAVPEQPSVPQITGDFPAVPEQLSVPQITGEFPNSANEPGVPQITGQLPGASNKRFDWKKTFDKYTGPIVTGSVAAVAAVILAVACGIFIPGESKAIVLPEHIELSQGAVTEKTPFNLSDTSITPDNVQRVVESLSRPEAYTASVTNTLYWNGTWDSIAAKQYVRDGITLIAYFTSDGIEERYEVVEEDIYYSWRRDGTSQYSASTGSLDRDDMSMIPTYENVIDLEKNQIIDAGLRTVNGESCIFVTVQDEMNGYELTYWISTVSGLLVQADYTREGLLARSVVVNDIVAEEPSAVLYILPDGTSLLPDVIVPTEEEEQTVTAPVAGQQPTA